MQRKITDYTEIIRTYNCEGPKAACEFIRQEFGVKNPWCVLKRMKTGNRFCYDHEKNQFLTDSANVELNPFLSLDQLCPSGGRKSQAPAEAENISANLDNLIKTLLEERLLQLSKYVQLNQPAKKILVDRSSMIADGFEVVIH